MVPNDPVLSACPVGTAGAAVVVGVGVVDGVCVGVAVVPVAVWAVVSVPVAVPVAVVVRVSGMDDIAGRLYDPPQPPWVLQPWDPVDPPRLVACPVHGPIRLREAGVNWAYCPVELVKAGAVRASRCGREVEVCP